MRKHCPRNKNEEKLSTDTRNLMKQRNLITERNDPNGEQKRKINREVKKAIRKDLRKYNTLKIEQTIENNKGLKSLRRKLNNGKSQIVKIKNKTDEITTNREELLTIVEDFYGELYKSRRMNETQLKDAISKTILNQGFELMPEITLSEI
ncbi:uncharacterized protein [Diabrotica undecimpunctata]|uniref:uncharacterized protein n=1 Tax=Diabrotica undecimpunctata TaxID=50387 RepID=UPI003B63A4AC